MKKKTRQRYLVIYEKKECAKFQKDRFSRFWATEFTVGRRLTSVYLRQFYFNCFQIFTE